MQEAPLIIDWIPGLRLMTHPRLGPALYDPELEIEAYDVYPCVTHLSTIVTRRMRCPCGQVLWNMGDLAWVDMANPYGPVEGHDLTGMSVAQVEALLDQVLPLEGPA
jgi:hypothetical protein